MRSGLLAFVAQNLRLGKSREALTLVLQPLLAQTPRPRARVHAGVAGRWSRALLQVGCEVRREELPLHPALPAEPVDLVCAGPLLGDAIHALQELATTVRPGGLVLLVTGRRVDRPLLCAALLHAGLQAPTQHLAGMSLLTAGRVPSAA